MSRDVVVLGGGFAGLSAATALAARGARVTVVEARPALGGRASSFVDPGTGERVDNGQHVLFGCYRHTFDFLRRIGRESAVRLDRRLALGMVDADGRASRLVCPSLPPPLHLAVGVMRWSALGWRDRLAILRMGRAFGLRRPPPASGETVRQWLVLRGQTPRLIEVLWEPLAVAALNQSIDEAAAGSFIGVLEGLLGPGRHDSALAIPLTPLDELYAEPSRRFIESRGGEVRTQAPARVDCRDRRVTVRDEPIESRAVVCAVPWHALPDVLDHPAPALASVVEDARATAASPIVTVNLWLDRAVTSDVFVGLPGRTMQWLFDKRSLFGARASHLSLVSSGAEAIVALSNEALVSLALEEVRAALPEAVAARLLRAVVVREKRATFSVAPGQPPRPSGATDVPGLFLAGDWIETGLPATIEGAVMSGHVAASAAAAYLELPLEG